MILPPPAAPGPRLAAALLVGLVPLLAGCGLVVSETGAPEPPASSPTARTEGAVTAVVERVVDGDTVIVDLDGDRTRVRLLNIDTPESVAEDRPVECLGAEAADFLEELLPPGDEVTLVHDVERFDQYDRMLAAAVTADGRNVSVELARAGLAEAITVGPNDRFRPDVQAAMEEAQRADRGLWDPDGPCAR